MNDNSLEEVLSKISQIFQTGDAQGAYDEAKKLLLGNPNNTNIRSYSAAFFIDSGAALESLEIVDAGIAIIEGILEEQSGLDSSVIFGLEYNLSNGYASRYKILRKNERVEESQEALRREKNLLQELLLNRTKIDRELLKKIMANYGNSLDHAGRTIEAIDQYKDCLRTFPDHAVAMANCGIATRYLIDIAESHAMRNLYEAWFLLSTACKDDAEILSLASVSALDHFKAHLVDLESKINFALDNGLDDLKNWADHRLEEHGHPKAPSWLAKINDDRLLLTLNQNPLNSTEECVDDLFFHNLITDIDDSGTQRFLKLANTTNNIKEDFATARYLFYQSDENEELAKRGSITHYADGLDYADFGLAAGIRKASFRLSADCLDKISVLLNEYYELGHEETRVNFNNFWFINRNPEADVHPVLESAIESNPFISALRNLQQDWFLQVFPGPLKSVRDAATHRRLVLYWMKPSGNTEKNEPSWDYDDFRAITFTLLRLVKAAIIYSVSAITIEDANKDAQSRKAAPMIFRFGPGLSEQYYADD